MDWRVDGRLAALKEWVDAGVRTPKQFKEKLEREKESHVFGPLASGKALYRKARKEGPLKAVRQPRGRGGQQGARQLHATPIGHPLRHMLAWSL